MDGDRLELTERVEPIDEGGRQGIGLRQPLQHDLEIRLIHERDVHAFRRLVQDARDQIAPGDPLDIDGVVCGLNLDDLSFCGTDVGLERPALVGQRLVALQRFAHHRQLTLHAGQICFPLDKELTGRDRKKRETQQEEPGAKRDERSPAASSIMFRKEIEIQMDRSGSGCCCFRCEWFAASFKHG